MSLILALDTSTDACGVALLDGQLTLASVSVTRAAGFGGHSEHVLELIAQAMVTARRDLRMCRAIAFGAGPGAFTGLRVACAVTQGLAFGLGIPVLPVDCLAAIALQGNADLDGRDSLLLVAQDARMQELYAGLYRVHQAFVETVEAPMLIGREALIEHARGRHVDAVIGSGVAIYPELGSIAPALAGHMHPDPVAIARLGAAQLARTGGIAANAAAPIYVRDRVALTISERAAGVRLPS